MNYLASRESLVDFFGVEPKVEYPDLPFEENVIEFEAEFEHVVVWFTIFPPGGWGELRVRGKPFSIVKLNLVDITHVFVRKTAQDHYLEIRFGSSGFEPLSVHIRPTVCVFWGNGNEGSDDTEHLERVSDA